MARYVCAVFVICSFLQLAVASDPFITMNNVRTVANTILEEYNKTQSGRRADGTVRNISTQLNSLLNNLTQMGVELRENVNATRINIPKNMQIANEIHHDLNIIFDNIIDISYLFNSYYLQYLNNTISESSLWSFIHNSIDLGLINIEKSAFIIYKTIYPGELGVINSSLMKRISKLLNTHVDDRCKLQQSPQQFLFDFYHLIATVETRVFLMSTSGQKFWSLTRYDPKAPEFYDYLDEFKRLTTGYLERMKNYLLELQRTTELTTLEVIRCEPLLLENYKIENLKAINKMEKESDYLNNMVMTGVRFVVKNQVLHIQIEEGKLKAMGEILPGSERWIPIDDMDYDSLTLNQHGQMIKINQGIEYHDIGSSDYLYLTSVVAPDLRPSTNFTLDSDSSSVRKLNLIPDVVIVGVNFDVYDLYPEQTSKNKKIIYIRLKYAEVNLTSGDINLDSMKYSTVLSEITSELESFATSRSELNENDKYIKLHTLENSYLYSNMYSTENNANPILFNFDSQALYVEPRLPFTGINIHKNGDPKNGVSVSLGVTTLDISFRIDAN